MPPPRHTLVYATATQVVGFFVEAIGAMAKNDALIMLSNASKSSISSNSSTTCIFFIKEIT